MKTIHYLLTTQTFYVGERKLSIQNDQYAKFTFFLSGAICFTLKLNSAVRNPSNAKNINKVTKILNIFSEEYHFTRETF